MTASMRCRSAADWQQSTLSGPSGSYPARTLEALSALPKEAVHAPSGIVGSEWFAELGVWAFGETVRL
jgi:hypothetical protein